MKDKYNNELKKGDLVAYGSRGIDGVTLAIVTNVEKNAIYSGGHQQGYGVYGHRLIKVSQETYQEQYDILMRTAKKWLKDEA